MIYLSKDKGVNVMSQRGKYSEQQKISTMKYIANKMDRIEIKVPKGKKEELSKIAQENGTNLTALMKKAIKEYVSKLGYDISLSMTDLNQSNKTNE